MSRCGDCRRSYPLTAEFWHRDRAKKRGFQSYCKPCQIRRVMQCRDPLLVAAARKRYRAAHHAEFLVKEAAYRATRRERACELQRRYYAEHHAAILERRRRVRMAQRVAMGLPAIGRVGRPPRPKP